MRRIRSGLAGASLLLVTCRAPEVATAPERTRAETIARSVALLDGTTPVLQFPAPPAYVLWRLEVELCSGLTREGWPTFWVAPYLTLNRDGAVGLYVRNQRRIVLALGYETVDWVVRHEMLHDLVNAAPGELSHPPVLFEERCGALVYPVAPRQAGRL